MIAGRPPPFGSGSKACAKQIVNDGTPVPRPEPGDGAPNEKITDWLVRINAVIAKMTADIPDDPANRTPEQQARWILANVIDWHRREEKAVWWEYFRLADLSAEDLLDEPCGLSGLSFVGEVGGTAPRADTQVPLSAAGNRNSWRRGFAQHGRRETWRGRGDFDWRAARSISRSGKTASACTPKPFSRTAMSIRRLWRNPFCGSASYVAENGMVGDGPYLAARDLLLREMPRAGGQPLHRPGETAVEAAVRLCGSLSGGILPIQGPPGAGKTYTGAQMICELVRRGKTVGITAEQPQGHSQSDRCGHRGGGEAGPQSALLSEASGMEDAQPRLSFARSNKDLFDALGNTAMVGAGTAWLWASPEAFETVDVLFVDEAAQMSLANVLAVSQAAKTVVLIGDPQQLDQPTQGSHPEGTDVSALDHILGGEQTISPDKGLFLEQTWRLHPDICAFTSELFYDGKLVSRAGLELQVINAAGPVCGSGLRYLPVVHHGNQNCSPEEADAVSALVDRILESNATWVDREGQKKPVTLDDIIIITPYNAQVFEIQQRLPGARVGTVDKFQGQETPIAIYSTATSSRADAPRGMEFLYSLNRLNVATSRAKCICIMVGSPELIRTDSRTPRQAQLANAFCRFLELAQPIL